MKRGKINNSTKGIGGWLLIILIDFIFSGLSTFILLIQKLIIIFTSHAKAGVYISAVLLVTYIFFIWLTAYMILIKKKFALKTFIISAVTGTIFLIWYYIVSQLINNNPIYIPNLLFVIVNIIITILIAGYLFLSKRVKNTLIK